MHMDTEDDEDEFCVKVIHVTPTTVTIYWIDPVVFDDTTVSYYLVSYNVTMRYQTAAGLTRLFNKSYTSHLPSNGPYSTFGIPLYSTYSTYVIQVTAVIDDGRMITSRDFTLSESEFNNLQAGQNDTTFFQLGLELTDPQTTLNCQPFEDDYGRILLQARSQLIEAAKNVCTSDDESPCAVQLTSDRLSCYNRSRIVYVARVIGTISTSAAEFLDYLRMLGPVEISLHNQIFSIMSLPSCPLSIPSIEESNCNQETVTTTTTIITPTSTTIGTPLSTTSTTITASNPASTSDKSNSTVVVIVTIACLVGIVILLMGIICVIVICYQCNRYHHNHSNSVNVEKDLFTVKSYSLIANTRSSSRRYLTDEERQWNLPAQSFILPSLPDHNSMLVKQQSNGQQQSNGRQHTIEHHITTDH